MPTNSTVTNSYLLHISFVITYHIRPQCDTFVVGLSIFSCRTVLAIAIKKKYVLLSLKVVPLHFSDHVYSKCFNTGYYFQPVSQQKYMVLNGASEVKK